MHHKLAVKILRKKIMQRCMTKVEGDERDTLVLDCVLYLSYSRFPYGQELGIWVNVILLTIWKNGYLIVLISLLSVFRSV